MDLSVVIPFCNEMPQMAFTTQALIEELDGFCHYEIILVDNMSHDHLVTKAGDREYPTFSRNYLYNSTTGAKMSTWFFRKGVIKLFIYDAKQGHWNAKNHGIANSTGKYVFFLDAHCIMKRDSVRKMLTFLRENEGKTYEHPMTPGKPWRVGAVHAYINYMLDSRSLEYKPQKKTFGYQFCSHQMVVTKENPRTLAFPTKPYQVCVMSTCGMMCPRAVLDDLGAWNPEFGIYGGGESYMNWKQSTCGYGHWIHPEAWCWHFADKRGYSWNHSDFVRNSFIAAYVVGGEEFLQQQIDARKKKENPGHIDVLANDVREKCKTDMEFIHGRQVIDFEAYIAWWEQNPGCWR